MLGGIILVILGGVNANTVMSQVGQDMIMVILGAVFGPGIQGTVKAFRAVKYWFKRG